MTTFLLYLVVSLFIFMALMLILLILIQKGRGGGLSASFGGGAGGHTAFGSKTGDVLTWATAIVFGIFLTLAIVANLVFNHVTPPGVAALPPTITPNSSTNSPDHSANGADAPGKPSGPGQPGSSLPPAPVTADPGVPNPPTVPPTVPPTGSTTRP